MFTVEYSKTSQKTLQRMPNNLAKRIFDKMNEVARNPYGQHNNVKPLRGSSNYRLRVGDWRVIYKIQDKRVVIFVLHIAPRGKAYK